VSLKSIRDPFYAKDVTVRVLPLILTLFDPSRNHDLTHRAAVSATRICSLVLEPTRNIWYFIWSGFRGKGACLDI
jgi:hypothetical protein